MPHVQNLLQKSMEILQIISDDLEENLTFTGEDMVAQALAYSHVGMAMMYLKPLIEEKK